MKPFLLGNRMNITQKRLFEVLKYDPETGRFVWIDRHNNRMHKDGRAGGSTANGYLSVRIDNKKYLLHRLAWLYVYGGIPDSQIDHKNGDGMDNRIENLRLCSYLENAQNRTKGRNASGFMGIKKVGVSKFKASICVNKKNIHIGTFNTAEEASQAYQEKKRELHPFWGGVTAVG